MNDWLIFTQKFCLVNIPSFLAQLDSIENNSIKEDASLKRLRDTAQTRNPVKLNPLSQISSAEFAWLRGFRRRFTQVTIPGTKNALHCQVQTRKGCQNNKEIPEVNEDEIAERYGYPSVNEEDEVKSKSHDSDQNSSLHRNDALKCGYIKPVPSQILTFFQDPSNKLPVHIDLDSGATVSYCIESEFLKRGFKIHPNGQMSNLDDGVTKLKGVGEIHETFFSSQSNIAPLW